MIVELNIKPYCNCYATGKFLRQDGYVLDPPSGLWVHSRCRKPSQMNYNAMISGRDQIPQPRVDDIYEHERKLDLSKFAKAIIDEELDWDYDDDD